MVYLQIDNLLAKHHQGVYIVDEDQRNIIEQDQIEYLEYRHQDALRFWAVVSKQFVAKFKQRHYNLVRKIVEGDLFLYLMPANTRDCFKRFH